MSAFLSRRCRAIDCHLELRRGKQGSSWLMAGNSAFLSSGDEYLVKLLEFHKACQVPFRVQGGTGLSLKTLQRKSASSSVHGRISWFVWSCGGKLRVPLELRVYLGDPLVSPQGRQISFGIEMGISGFLELCCRDK